jgi:membrane fusion protein, multidrug efflux system
VNDPLGQDDAAHRRLVRFRLIIVIGVVLVLFGLLETWHLVVGHFIKQAQTANAAPPQTVTTTVVGFTLWQPQLAAVGSVRAVHGVYITTEIAGLVRSINFRNGDDAHAGETLVQLNADSDVATLRSLEASADLAQTVYNRDKVQLDAQAISQAQLDADAADLRNKRAQAASQAATVAKKSLRAPFDGRLGITTVNPGQYLNTGDKVVSLESLDPVYVDFRLPQQQLPQVKEGVPVEVQIDAFPQQSFTGKVTALDPAIDTGSRNFQAEATIANPDHKLMPGMFAKVAVDSGDQQRYLTLPQTAITYNPYGSTVFLVQKGKDGKPIAQQTFVTTGATRGDQVAILKGVKEGDEVVTTGQLKLKNGTSLVISTAAQPLDSPNPTPQEH